MPRCSLDSVVKSATLFLRIAFNFALWTRSRSADSYAAMDLFGANRQRLHRQNAVLQSRWVPRYSWRRNRIYRY